MESSLIEQIKLELSRSQESFLSAQVLFKEGLYADCMSRAYYSILHAARALLLVENIKPVSHSGVINQFSLNFIKPQLLDKKFGKIISRASNAREESDYNIGATFSREDAKLRIEEANSFIKEVKLFLKKKQIKIS